MLRKDWILTKEAREIALAQRHQVWGEAWADRSKDQQPLELGQVVQVQNQRGPRANKWDLSGTIVEVQEFDSYLVRMDGRGRVTKRNRRYLKPIKSFMSLLSYKDRVHREGMLITSGKPVLTLPERGTGGHTSCAGGLLDTGSAPCARSAPCAEQETEGNSAAGPRVQLEQNTGRAYSGTGDQLDVTAPELNSDAGPRLRSSEQDRGHDTSVPEVAAVPEINDLGKSSVTTQSLVMTRPVRVRKEIDRLVVGNTSDPRFNRKKRRKRCNIDKNKL